MIVEIRDEVVALSGVLQRNHWPTLKSAVNVRLKHHPSGIVVDCGGLERLTPEGAQTFRSAASHIAASGARIVVANVPPDVLRVLRQVPNIGSQLPIAATIAEARVSLGLPTRPRASLAGDETGDVVAALLGTEADAHAVALACRLAPETQGRVHLAYLLVVPRNIPLQSVMAEQEDAVRQALEAWDTAVRRAGRMPVPRVERTRDPTARLLEIAGESRTMALVLAFPADPAEDLVSMAWTLLARAACDVVIDRLQPHAASVSADGAAASPAAKGGAA